MLPLIDNPWFYVVAVPALVFAGISKGGLGGGVGGVSVPLMAMIISPTQAAAVMLPILCVMDLPAIHAYFGRWDRRLMRIMLPAGLVGIVLGTFSFRYLDDNWIRLLLGAIALGFLAGTLVRRNPAPVQPSKARGWFWSGLAGYTSFVAHAGGPPLSVYLLPQRLDKTVFVATSVAFFATANYAKLIPYFWLGLFDTRNIATSAALFPVGIAGVYLGVWVHKYINALWFYRIFYALLFLSGSKLLYDGITRL